MAGELFKMMAGIDMVHVPYRGGGPAITDLIAGQVQVYFASTPASIEYIRAGKLCALATRETAGSAVAPAVRCKNVRRGSFILNLPLASRHSITVGAGKGVTAGMMRLRVVYPIHMSAFQLAFELIEEAPIGGIGDDVVGERPDHACFA